MDTTVFLVEDEIVEREGLMQAIDWEKNGFELVGDSSDGELAYPLILKTKPDILITDIKMPFMDGLELSKLVRQALPNTKIIVLSGYDNFSYAQQGIAIGIASYLMKPIASKLLIQTLCEVRDNINEERRHRTDLERYKTEWAENETILQTKLFFEMLTRNLTYAQLKSRADKLNVTLDAPMYNVLLIKSLLHIDDASQAEPELQNLCAMLRKQFKTACFESMSEGIALLIKAQNAKDIQAQCELLLQQIAKFMQQYEAVDYFVGVGTPCNRATEIHISYESASKALALRYVQPQAIVFYAEQITQNEMQSQNPIMLNKPDQQIVENFLRNGLQSETEQFITDYFQNIGQDSLQSFVFRQYIVMDNYFSVLAFLEKLGIDKEEFLKANRDVAISTSTPEDVKPYTERLIKAALTTRDMQVEKRNASLVEVAKQYMQANYNSEDISLQQVAKEVNVSAGYFSTIFRQEEGVTFIECLTQYRMDKAKELLRCTSMKISEIGYTVGYGDAHYFSYLFKKICGCTPKEYRTGDKK